MNEFYLFLHLQSHQSLEYLGNHADRYQTLHCSELNEFHFKAVAHS